MNSTKTITINITSIKNGFVVSGEDSSIGGVFGQPLETDNVFFPDLETLYESLPKIVRTTFDLGNSDPKEGLKSYYVPGGNA